MLTKDKSLPDVAHQRIQLEKFSVDWVGMDNIEFPIRVSKDNNYLSSAKIDAKVNLLPEKGRGIHMSRIYKILRDELLNVSIFDQLKMKLILDQLIQSQDGQSDCVKLNFKLDYYLKKKSLLSDEWGWMKYPIFLSYYKNKDGIFKHVFGFKVQYSSTCPASAALSKSAWIDKLTIDMKNHHWSLDEIKEYINNENNKFSFPHAQRSEARIRLKFAKEDIRIQTIEEIILMSESFIGTPVQLAVKRVDEQEFARLNGENLMFCEDAVRKIINGLSQQPSVKNAYVKVAHLESLHPHDAVAELKWSRD